MTASEAQEAQKTGLFRSLKIRLRIEGDMLSSPEKKQEPD
jgi:hypothetical protein